MKKLLVPFLIALLAWTVFTTAADAKTSTFTTGRDWVERMSEAEKFMAIVAPMSVFHHAGVRFRLRPEEYIPQVERVLTNNPYLEIEDVSNVFASTVYAYEPESRMVFEHLAEGTAEGRMYLNEGFTPRLLIAPAGHELRKDAIA